MPFLVMPPPPTPRLPLMQRKLSPGIPGQSVDNPPWQRRRPPPVWPPEAEVVSPDVPTDYEPGAIAAVPPLVHASPLWLAAALHAPAGPGAVAEVGDTQPSGSYQPVLLVDFPAYERTFTSRELVAIPAELELARFREGGVGALTQTLDEFTDEVRLGGVSVAFINPELISRTFATQALLWTPVQLRLGFVGLAEADYLDIFTGRADRWQSTYAQLQLACIDTTLQTRINLAFPLDDSYEWSATPQTFNLGTLLPLVMGVHTGMPVLQIQEYPPAFWRYVVGLGVERINAIYVDGVPLGLSDATVGWGNRAGGLPGDAFGILQFILNDDPGGAVVTVDVNAASPIFAYVSSTEPPVGTNLLVNGDFEPIGNTAGWIGVAGALLTIEDPPTAAPYQGNFCAALVGATEGVNAEVYQDCTTVPGMTYTYEAAMFRVANLPAGASFGSVLVGPLSAVGFYGGHGNTIYNAWQVHTGTFVAIDGVTRLMVQSAWTTGATKVYFDSLKIAPAPAEAQPIRPSLHSATGENPVDLITWLLTTFDAVARVDVQSFEAARVAKAALKMRGWFTAPSDSLTLAQRVARQAGMLLQKNAQGQYMLTVLDDDRPVTFVFDPVNMPDPYVLITSTPADALYTSIYVYYDTEHGGSTNIADYAQVAFVTPTTGNATTGLVAAKAACQAALDIVGKEQRLEFFADLITHPGTAFALLAWLVGRYTPQYVLVQWRTWLDAMPLRLGDIVEVTHPLLPILEGSARVELVGHTFDPATMTLTLTGRTPALLYELETEPEPPEEEELAQACNFVFGNDIDDPSVDGGNDTGIHIINAFCYFPEEDTAMACSGDPSLVGGTGAVLGVGFNDVYTSSRLGAAVMNPYTSFLGTIDITGNGHGTTAMVAMCAYDGLLYVAMNTSLDSDQTVNGPPVIFTVSTVADLDEDTYYDEWVEAQEFAVTFIRVGAMAEHNGALYVALEPKLPGTNALAIWQFNGTSWSLQHSFGTTFSRLRSFFGVGAKLYAGVDGELWYATAGAWALAETFTGDVDSISFKDGLIYANVRNGSSREIWRGSSDDNIFTLFHTFSGETGTLVGPMATGMPHPDATEGFLYVPVREADGTKVYRWDGVEWTMDHDYGDEFLGVSAMLLMGQVLFLALPRRLHTSDPAGGNVPGCEIWGVNCYYPPTWDLFYDVAILNFDSLMTDEVLPAPPDATWDLATLTLDDLSFPELDLTMTIEDGVITGVRTDTSFGGPSTTTYRCDDSLGRHWAGTFAITFIAG